MFKLARNDADVHWGSPLLTSPLSTPYSSILQQVIPLFPSYLGTQDLFSRLDTLLLFSPVDPLPHDRGKDVGKAELDVDTTSLSNRLDMQGKFPDLHQIMSQKIESRGDSSHIDVLEFYETIMKTKGKPLTETYPQLYDVLQVKVRKESDNIKMVRNNINFKIKNMLESYPHLRFYGDTKDFNLTRIQAVPQVLVTINKAELRKQFQETRVGRVKNKDN